MHRWVVRWDITIEWEKASDSPFRCKVLEKRCKTVAELRWYVENARRDRWVIRFPYRAVRELAGTAEESCPNGHPLDGNTANKAKSLWAQCGCGGHLVMICKVCQAKIVDPVPDESCETRNSDMAGKR